MAIDKTLLDTLRSQSQVDCDTLDYEVAEALGPFVDCTSNQAIAYGELQKQKNASVITESIQVAKDIHKNHANDVSHEQLATEVMMVKLSSRIVKHLTGHAHIQTNPYYAYSKQKTIANAERIIAIYRLVSPDFDSSRVCIKIPSTWEGIQACGELEKKGIHTLATTLFSMEQAALASAAGCTYIAPYVNELRVHFERGYVDNDKGFALTRAAQQYFESTNSRTKVLPASLVSVAEVMRLAGVHHITVSPPLLAELASTPAASASATEGSGDGGGWFGERDAEESGVGRREYLDAIVRDQGAWRMAYTRSKGGADEKKLVDAINIFADMQDRMEGLVRAKLG